MTELVAQSRWPKNPKALQLDAHREELLRLRRAGESVAAIGAGLRKLGVAVSDEALRLWLNRELGHTPVRRRKARTRREARSIAASGCVATTAEHAAPLPPAAAIVVDGSRPDSPPAATANPSGRPSSLILSGETPLQAMRRRLAVLAAEKAANAVKPD